MATSAAPIIVRKKKGGGGDAHHGGAWKVAYADFVTAMMAFFLLLWLLNSTTQEQRSGISEYFNAASVARTTSGAGQILGGATITLDGPSKGKGAPIGVPIPTPETSTKNSDSESEDKVEAGPKEERVKDQDNAGKNKDQPPEDASEAQMKEIMRKREEKTFEQVEAAIKRAIEATPGLRKLAENLIVDRTDEGLRIQIVDQDRTAMFARGSSVPYQHTHQLLEAITKVIAALPNKVSISGHTDSTPYARGATYTNWELSSDRAQAARRSLSHYGLAGDRITRVVGRSDTEHLVKSDPNSPRNRRIAITLLHQTPIPPEVSNVAHPPVQAPVQAPGQAAPQAPAVNLAPAPVNIAPLPPKIVPGPAEPGR
ncbi:MAG: hypothetical protein RL477_1207 [Pseudomonadota bacterium]|jgi:chemotaxis protein MotB